MSRNDDDMSRPFPGESATDDPGGQQGLANQAGRIFDAEIVYEGPLAASPHQPLRFGLRALLALMAICSAQFALMSYVGTLPGLVVTAVLCLGLMALLLVGPLFIPSPSRARWMDWLDLLAIRLTIAIVLLVAGAVFAGGGMALFQQVESLRVARRVQHRLGFAADIEMVLTADSDGFSVGTDALIVRSVTPSGAFARAGFQKDDAILTDMTPREYYRMLDEMRGNTITVSVASGAVGGVLTPVEDCPQRDLTLVLPP